MKAIWPAVPLRELCDDVQYGYTASSSVEPIGPKLLRITDIVPVRLSWDAVPYCEIEPNKFPKYQLSAGDIVVARTGATVGYAKLLTTPPRSVFASYLVRFRVNDANDPRYVGKVIESNTYKDYIKAHAGGAAQPNANAQVLGSFPVPLPPLHVQRKISAVLAAYDELIENNLRRIEILEEMAQAVYREWFINFRFPGHEDVALVDSPLGPIPEGWEGSTLGEESSVVMGQSPKSKFYNDDGVGLPFHQGVTNFGTLFPEHVKHCTVEARIAEAGDTLVSVRAPVGRINVADARMVIGRGLAAVRNLDNESPGFHYRQLRHAFREEDSMGGGTIYKAITKGDLLGVPWLLPPRDIRAAFDSLERPLFSLTAILVRQNANLRMTRDLLLPKLVSGGLDVSDLGIDTEWLAS
jgi:type I restriction enzyme S subunit